MYLYYFKDEEEINQRAFARLSSGAAVCVLTIRQQRHRVDESDGALSLVFDTDAQHVFIRGNADRSVLNNLLEQMEYQGAEVSSVANAAEAS